MWLDIADLVEEWRDIPQLGAAVAVLPPFDNLWWSRLVRAMLLEAAATARPERATHRNEPAAAMLLEAVDAALARLVKAGKLQQAECSAARPLLLRWTVDELPALAECAVAVVEDGPDGPLIGADARIARLFEDEFRWGPDGPNLAAKVLESARMRWADYVGDPQPALPSIPTAGLRGLWSYWLPEGWRHPAGVLVAAAYLLGGRRIGELRDARGRPPALSLPLIEEIGGVLRRGWRYAPEARALVADQRRPVAVDHGPRPDVPSVDLAVVGTILDAAAGDLGRVAAYRLTTWIVHEAHRRAEALPPSAVPELRIEGGWPALAELIGTVQNTRNLALLKRTAILLDRIVLRWPDGSHGRLFSLRYRDDLTGPGRRTWVRIVPEPPLLPGYVQALPRGTPGRRLVPWPALPPLVGRERDHGAVLALALLALAELRLYARDLVEAGGARVPLDRWHELADRAGCPRPTAELAVERWADGSWLRRVGGDRYTLADADARAFIEAAGAEELAGQAGGKRSSQLRRDRRKR